MENIVDIQISSINIYNKIISDIYSHNNKINDAAFRHIIKHGIILDIQLLGQMDGSQQMHFAEILASKYGISNTELRSSLWKKVETIKSTNELQLFIAQLTHYTSTYENNDNVKNSDRIYEPEQIVNNHDIDKFAKAFKVIGSITKDELKDHLRQTISQNIPLLTQDVYDLFDLCVEFMRSDIDIDHIKNNELKSLLQKQLFLLTNSTENDLNDVVIPKHNIEFLRFIVDMVSDQPLLIKSDRVIDLISFGTRIQSDLVEVAFKAYKEQVGFVELAKIFNRYKPLFLAFKVEQNHNLRTMINQISRLSKKHHKPMKPDLITNAINLIKTGQYTHYDIIHHIKQNDVDTYALIKLCNAARLKIVQASSSDTKIAHLYKMRNGETYIKHIDQQNESIKYLAELAKLAKQVKAIIKTRIINNIQSTGATKVILTNDLNNRVDYKLPTSSKNFIGELPEFSSVDMEGNIGVGITWYQDADLDLSCYNVDNKEHISWYTMQKTNSLSHTGDMTDLNDKGFANESVFVDKQNNDKLIFDVVTFDTRLNTDHIDYKLTLSENVKYDELNKSENVLLQLPMKSEVNRHGRNIAIKVPSDHYEHGSKIIVTQSSTGRVTVSGKDLSSPSLQAINDKAIAHLSLNQLLKEIKQEDEQCDITFIDESELHDYQKINEQFKNKVEYIDLRPYSISKHDILSIVK